MPRLIAHQPAQGFSVLIIKRRPPLLLLSAQLLLLSKKSSKFWVVKKVSWQASQIPVCYKRLRWSRLSMFNKLGKTDGLPGA